MKNKITMAVVGLGQRGSGLLSSILVKQNDLEIVGVSDTYLDRTLKAKETVIKECGNTPFASTDYKEVLDKTKPDSVLVSTAWEYHIEVALYAMEKGIAVAMEVGGAYNDREIEKLVETYERTKTPFMFMENCCFNKEELLATSMARKGLFGKIVHLEGAYAHDLREEIAGGNINRHYRLRNYLKRNCENYPTHEIGPIAKILDINRGNRFVSLVSIASKSEGLKEYVNEHKDKYPELVGLDFKQGDIVTTIITCANGETVFIKLDTTLPRFYARNFTVRGTKGFYEQNTNLVFFDGDSEEWDTAKAYKERINNASKYEEEYLPAIWKNITKEQLDAGHGGMDYFVFRAFIDCLKEGREMPIDVYDAATWMSITELSEKSIALGGAPVYFKDYTGGKWHLRERKDVVEF